MYDCDFNMRWVRYFSKTTFSVSGRAQYLFLVMLFVSPMVIMPLSTPVMSDMIVVMHHDDAVHTAVRTITDNVHNVRVIEYNSLEYVFTIHRVVGRVVWVSHGSDNGINTNDETIPWEEFSHNIHITPNRDIVIACHSANINNFVSTADVIGIDGLVDAQLGGLVAAYLLAPSFELLDKAMTHVADLVSGDVEPCLLAPFEVTLSLWWDWYVLHGSIKVRYNILAIFAFAMIAFCCWVGGSIWDAVGVILDIFSVSFGNVLLDWLWPVIIKPALQVILCAAFGVMSGVITAVTSTIRALASMMFIQALVAMLTYVVVNVVVPFAESVGWGWLAYPLTVVLIKKLEDAATGPIARNVARYANLGDSFKKAADKIGFGLVGGIVIAVVEAVLEGFFYTYASRLTVEWTGGF